MAALVQEGLDAAIFLQTNEAVDYVAEPATFRGIVRADGRIATRNYIGILTTVNCSATVAEGIARHFTAERLSAYPNIDGVVSLTHGMGCCMDTQGEGMQMLQRTMAGYARHPNFAGIVMVGLGCEANQIESLTQSQSLKESSALQMFTIQDTGGTAKTVARGIAAVEAMLDRTRGLWADWDGIEGLIDDARARWDQA